MNECCGAWWSWVQFPNIVNVYFHELLFLTHSVNSIYCLDGKVPETYMSSETAEFSKFYKLALYNWIMYCPDTINYSDEPLHLGKYLGPTIYVGPEMTAKIVQHNRGEVYCSTYRPHTIEE